MSYLAEALGSPEHPAEARAAMTSLNLDAPLTVAFRRHLLPPRVENLMMAAPFREISLADAIVERRSLDGILRRHPNVGRKTSREFWSLVMTSLACQCRDRGLSPAQIAMLAGIIGVDVAHLEVEPDLWDEIARLEALDRLVAKDLIHLCQAALRLMDGRETEILGQRFPPDFSQEMTLEQIGDRYQVTRERIRQIESRALRKLRTHLPAERLAGLFNQWADAWSSIAGDSSILLRNDLLRARRRLDGRLLLLLEIAGSNLPAFLDRHAHEFPRGWLRPDHDAERISELADQISASLSSKALPRPLDDLGDADDVRIALLLTAPLQVSGGYVFGGRLSARPRRTAAAHALLAAGRQPMAIRDLHYAYVRMFDADPCSPRDLVKVMEEAPHLFLETAEGDWAPIGGGGARPIWPSASEGEPPADDPAEEDLSEGEDGDPTVAEALFAELEHNGPQSIGQLFANAKRILPRGRSKHSIGPILISRPDLFERILPGVYALVGQVPTADDVLRQPLPFLLNPAQARLFAYARRAGEPWGAFRLWTPEAEMRLCHWARREDNGELYRSLLALADIDAWPASEDLRVEWRDLQRRYGRYDLVSALREEQAYEKMPMDRILAALTDLQAKGNTNWVRLNRILNHRVNSQAGCALLVALSALRAVRAPARTEPSPWQLPHEATDVADQWARKLGAARHARGQLAWDSDLGAELAQAILAGRCQSLSWANPDLIARAYAHADVEPASDRAPEVELVADRRMQEFLDWLEDA